MTTRTTEPSGNDVRRCFDLVHDCLDEGADHTRWLSRLSDGLRDLIGASAVIGAEVHGLAESADARSRRTGAAVGEHEPSVRSVERRGWDDDTARARWESYARETPVRRTPEFPLLRQRLNGGSVRRAEVWPERTWERSRIFNDVHRACGLDDYVLSVRPLSLETNDGVSAHLSLFLHRAVGDAAFSERERRMLAIVHDEVATRVGRLLAHAGEPSLDALTPRRREVLEHLLRGLSEKEIAAELCRSRAAVHEHVLAIYRHFDVRSRAELMARFVGRAEPRRVSNQLGSRAR